MSFGASMILGMVGRQVCSQTVNAVAVMPEELATSSEAGRSFAQVTRRCPQSSAHLHIVLSVRGSFLRVPSLLRCGRYGK